MPYCDYVSDTKQHRRLPTVDAFSRLSLFYIKTMPGTHTMLPMVFFMVYDMSIFGTLSLAMIMYGRSC